MRWIKALAAIGAIGISTSSSAAGTATNAKITGLELSTVDGNEVFIEVSVTKSGNPACSTSGTFAFVLPMGTAPGYQMYATLLAVRSSQAEVTLTGTGTCSVYSSVETLATIFY